MNSIKDQIFGVRVDNLAKKDILEKINEFLSEPCFHRIATVNPEFILEAQKNPEFKKVLNASELNVADGVGIWFAFLRHGKYLKSRMAGADLMLEILRLAEKNNLAVFLAANKDGLSTWQETRDAIFKIYPKLAISGADLNQLDTECPIGHSVSILFCNFGAPQQELFIQSQKRATIRLAMGVGGSFDFLTGKAKRAPLFLRRLGLEWLWRLILQPRRIKRIFNAVIIFPVKVIFSK
jgi:N-acetylglucosaminyldiphosphoundecaprenol N-acetyl-beta-D-mannosaminyltransferase